MEHLLRLARSNGSARDPVLRQRLVKLWTGLRLMQFNAARTMCTGVPGPEASISKLFWGTWHRDMTNAVLDVLGPGGVVSEEGMTSEQALALFARSDTIYGGSNEIQRNVLGERVLGLPKEPS
jgi:alkylation response protein AidB-like acyl-CoA dehydrogenase